MNWTTNHTSSQQPCGEGRKCIRTAMAKTVGLPLGIAARLILENKIILEGLHIPIIPEIYEPVLQELGKKVSVLRKKLIDFQVLGIDGFILHIPEDENVETPSQVKCIITFAIGEISLIRRNHLSRFCPK